MPEFLGDQVFVDEDDVLLGQQDQDNDIFVDEDFVFDDLMVEEDRPGDDEVVVEDEHRDVIPGSDSVFVDEADDNIVEEKAKDWSHDKDHSQFIAYMKEKLTKIPRHSGETVPGCERAKAYLKSLDSEISSAMRSDLDGAIDETDIDNIRKRIEDDCDRLDKQIKKLRGTKRASIDVKLVSDGHCSVCNSNVPVWHDVSSDKTICMSCNASNKQEDNETLEKTAGTPVLNVYVSAFERAVVGTIINSAVSAGKNIEETYSRMKGKYNFTPREELAIIQLIADYGYPVGLLDRASINEDSDPSSGESAEWITNYNA